MPADMEHAATPPASPPALEPLPLSASSGEGNEYPDCGTSTPRTGFETARKTYRECSKLRVSLEKGGVM